MGELNFGFGSGGGGGAPIDAEYLTLAVNATLTNERRFVPGTNLSAVDGGAGGDYTLNAASTGAPVNASYIVVGLDASLTDERRLQVGAGLSLVDGGAGGDLTIAVPLLGITTGLINDAAVTYAKIQNVTDARLLGRSAGSAGAPQEISIGTGLSLAAGVLSNPGVGANPSASVGLAAVNGAAATFMRSDGAPALSQSITPTWSGQHTFTASIGFEINNAQPAFQFNETDQGADGKIWRWRMNGGIVRLETRTDAGAVGTEAFAAARTGTAVTSVNLGNATDNPSYGFLGTGTATFSGKLAVVGNVGFNNQAPAAMPDYTVTNPSTSRSIDVSAATLAQVRAVVGTMISDLIAIGLYQ